MRYKTKPHTRLNHQLLKRELAVTIKELEKLKSSDESEKYLKMFRKNPQPMWIYDLETLRFLEQNDAAIEVYGYSREEFLSMTLVDIRPPEDVPALFEDVKSTWKQYNNAGVWRHIKKNGEIIFVSIVSHEIEHNGRKARHVMISDVTEEIKNRDALEISESNFRQLFENNISVMLIIDPETGNILGANKAALRYYGYSYEEILSLTIYDINTLGKALNSEIDKALNAEQIYFEFKHRKKNGELRDVEVFSSRLNLGGKLRLHSIIHDVTEKKMALDRIKLLSNAIEQSPVSVLITDSEGLIEYANPKFTETSGYSQVEVIGKNPRILNSGRQSKEFYTELWNTIKAGYIWEGELINRKKDGSLYWENLIISPVQNESGKTNHFVAVKEDITEAKTMFQNMELAKEQAEEANRVKSSFLNNMSHEFRTPLIAILGYTEVLREEVVDQDHLDMLHKIEKSGNRLFETLKAILEISRIEGGRFPINFEFVDINEVVSSQCEVFEQFARARDITLTKNIPDTKMMVSLDKKLFIQVIDNLLDNALKFTKNGEITVILQQNPLPPIDGKHQYEVKLCVKDTGIGIEADKKELIFEDFRQGSEGYSRAFEGAGLGLSIVKKFTHKMGGRVDLQSEPGVGSSFYLYFPLVMDKEIIEVATVAEKADDVVFRKKNVLIVEDDPMVIDIITKMLGKICDVESAKDGFEAIGKVREKQYELILLDINLGIGMNGLAALNEIRLVSGYHSVPVIAITAYVMDGFKEHVLAAGCDDYLAKPFTYTQLLHIVKKWINSDKSTTKSN